MLKTCVKKQGCYGSKDPEADHGNGLKIKELAKKQIALLVQIGDH